MFSVHLESFHVEVYECPVFHKILGVQYGRKGGCIYRVNVKKIYIATLYLTLCSLCYYFVLLKLHPLSFFFSQLTRSGSKS